VIRHIALFKWHAHQEPDLDRLTSDLLAVIENHGIEDAAPILQVGLGLSGPQSYDFAITADFTDEESYLAYRTDPAHQQILQQTLLPAAEMVAAIQVRVDDASGPRSSGH
jgi:hypothetical protein